MAQPSANFAQYVKTGNPMQNLLEDDHRIYTDELDNALVDKSVVEGKAHAQ